MNDDEFEHRLCSLTSRLERPDPTPGWKQEILARAAQSRQQAESRAPRWLLAALGTAWVLIALLRFTTPDDPAAPHHITASAPAGDPAMDTPWRALMAFQSNPELLDLP